MRRLLAGLWQRTPPYRPLELRDADGLQHRARFRERVLDTRGANGAPQVKGPVG